MTLVTLAVALSLSQKKYGSATSLPSPCTCNTQTQSRKNAQAQALHSTLVHGWGDAICVWEVCWHGRRQPCQARRQPCQARRANTRVRVQATTLFPLWPCRSCAAYDLRGAQRRGVRSPESPSSCTVLRTHPDRRRWRTPRVFRLPCSARAGCPAAQCRRRWSSSASNQGQWARRVKRCQQVAAHCSPLCACTRTRVYARAVSAVRKFVFRLGPRPRHACMHARACVHARCPHPTDPSHGSAAYPFFYFRLSSAS